MYCVDDKIYLLDLDMGQVHFSRRNPKFSKIQCSVAQHQKVPDQWLGDGNVLSSNVFDMKIKILKKVRPKLFLFSCTNNFGS